MTEPASFAQLQTLSTEFAGLAAKVAPSLVSVRAHRSRSSGFVWRPGLIVTAEQALPEEDDFSVTLPGGDAIAARLVGRDPTTDVAVLRIERSDPPPVSLVASALAVGSLALAIGAEDGTPTVALGVVSRAAGPWRSVRGGEIDARVELDLRMRQSAEGGVALDAAGQIFGMAIFGPRQRVLVLPSATIERVAARLESHGRIERGYLGLGLRPVAIDGDKGTGAMVMSVDPKGPGAIAGIHQGDILVAWNGDAIGQVHKVLRALGPDSVGKPVTIGLRRAGEIKQVQLTVTARPSA